MKILFFIHSIVGGGAERVLVNLSDEFIKRGDDVSIYMNDCTIAYSLNDKINVFCDSEKGGCKNRIVRFITIHYNRYRSVKRIIRSIKPDIIIASWGSPLLDILLNHRKTPVIASEHNTFNRRHTFNEYLNRFFLNRFCDKVVVLTRFDKAFMARCLNNTVVIPNPLSFSPLNLSDFESSFNNRKNILACGRLNAHYVKGFDLLIQSFANIAAHYPQWDLDIAGIGINGKEDEDTIYSMAKKCGVLDRVHLLGFRSDIAEVMRSHSIFALSSRSEGFGMVLTEAMAMGCACVSFDLTGPAEILLDGIDGVLVDNQNVKSFSMALSRLIENPSERKQMGYRAICDVKRFDSSKIANQWEHLFTSVLNNK